jgi:hypothetical protein
MAVCNQITLAIIHNISSRIVTLLKIIDAPIQSPIYFNLMLVSSSPTLVFRYYFFLFLKCPLPSPLTLFRLHKLSQRRLTADWLAPQESNCSRMHSKVPSDWLPSYIKATQPVFHIFKMAGYFQTALVVNWFHSSPQCLPKIHCLYRMFHDFRT